MAQMIDLTGGDDDLLSDLKSRLINCLEHDQFGSDICHFEGICDPINPGLYIDCLGAIGLPLSEPEVDRIAKQNGTKPKENVVISEYHLTLANPAWKKFMKGIEEKLSVLMGLNDFHTKFSKMIIQTGSVPKASELLSTRNEKNSTKIGTLALCLPSYHAGADILFSRNGLKKQFDTSKHSDFDCSMFTWFSDVAVELGTVTSGYRLLFIYNILQPRKGKLPNAAVIQNTRQDFSEALESWKNSNEKSGHEVPGILVWILEKKLEDKSLCLSELKGRDRQLANVFSELCSRNGTYMYLANITKEVTGTCYTGDDDDWQDREAYDFEEIVDILEETDVDFILTKIVDPDGTEVSKDVDIQPESIIQEDPFGSDPDSGDHEDDTAHHFYNASAVVMVLPSYRPQMILGRGYGNGTGIKCIMDTAIKALQDPIANPAANEEMLYMSRYIINKFRGPQDKLSTITGEAPFSNVLDLAVRGSLLVDKPDFNCDITGISEQTYKELGVAIVENGFSFVQTTLTSGVSKITETKSISIK